MAAAEATDSAELILILCFYFPPAGEPRGLFLFFFNLTFWLLTVCIASNIDSGFDI